MSDALQVRRLHARYRLAQSDTPLRGELDALLGRVAAEALEPALARRGVPAGEEICLRAVQAPVRLPRGSDAGAVATWAEAIATAIAAQIEAGGADVVRYRSRRAGLTDFARSVAVGRLDRVWAWRRLGLWRGGDQPGTRAAAAELVAALTREPEAIAPVLAAVARGEPASQLPELIGVADWCALAARALAAARVPATVLLAAAESVRATRAGPARPDDGQPPGQALAPAGGRRGGEVDDAQVPQAWDDAEASAAAAVAREAAIALRRAVDRILAGSAIARAAGTVRDPELAAALAVLAVLERDPAALAARPVAAAAELVARLAERLAGPASGPADETPAGAGTASAPEAEAEARAERHLTRWGGLLFLLSVLDELELPAELAAAPRPLAWTLHLLALALVPLETDDPAALAFAGLAPEAEPPTLAEPPEEHELRAASALAARLADELADRLGEPDVPAAELLEFVCARRGEIVFEPGWIELRLPLEEVSVELRRAGLDLDPGWLPWLGAVLRFVYA